MERRSGQKSSSTIDERSLASISGAPEADLISHMRSFTSIGGGLLPVVAVLVVWIRPGCGLEIVDSTSLIHKMEFNLEEFLSFVENAILSIQRGCERGNDIQDVLLQSELLVRDVVFVRELFPLLNRLS